MTIVALAEQHPELFGDRVVGVGLISTTAGGLDPSRILLPDAPGQARRRADAPRRSRTLARGHRTRRRRCAGSAASWPRVVDRPVRVRRRGAGGVRRLRRRDAVGDAVRGGRRVLPELPRARQVRRRRGARPGADHGHLRHRATSSPRSATAASCTTRIARLDPAGVRGRRPHGDPRAARPGQRRARPAARRRRASGSACGDRPSRSSRSAPRRRRPCYAVVRAAFEARPPLDPPAAALAETARVARAAAGRARRPAGPRSTASRSARSCSTRSGSTMYLRRFGVRPRRAGPRRRGRR